MLSKGLKNHSESGEDENESPPLLDEDKNEKSLLGQSTIIVIS